MLTAAEIASMKDTIGEALPDTCTIRRKAQTSDGGGGWEESWSDHATGVACGIAPVSGGESTAMAGGGSMQGGRVVDESTHILTLPAGADITEADRVVQGATTYDVTLVRKRAAWELSLRVELKEAG